MKKQLDFLVQYEEEFQGWQRRSSGKFTICYLVFLRKRRRWAFLNTLQALDPPTFKTFGLTFLRKRLWASLICSKTARYRLFLAVVRCCVTTTLAAETFSLLCVYLNYKFGLGLPSVYLFLAFSNWYLPLRWAIKRGCVIVDLFWTASVRRWQTPSPTAFPTYRILAFEVW